MSDEKPKGGYLARKAAMLCQDDQFRLYLDRRRSAKFELEVPDGTHTEDDAKDFLLAACAIASRAELDHNPEAATMFRYINRHYQAWVGRQHRRARQSPETANQQR